MNISCIIPTKNRCRMLGQAIDSVMRQTQAELEIVVVDDGSTDNTFAETRRQFPAVQIVRLPGLGPGLARDAGVKACSGDILMFLDSDDIWYDHHAADLLAVIKRGFQVAYGVTITRNEISNNEFLIPADGNGRSGDCFTSLINWCFLVPSSIAMTREAYSLAGGFGPEPIGEDWCFFLRLAARFPFGFSNSTPITLRRLHKESLCYLTNADKLLTLVRHLTATLRSEEKTRPADLVQLARMEQVIKNRGNGFRTVQDWYLALQEELSC